MPKTGKTPEPTRTSEHADALVMLLTPAEAAKHLAISTRQLRDLTQNGSIRYVNIGQRDRETRRYHPSDIEAFIEERRMWAPRAATTPSAPSMRVFGMTDFQKRMSKRR